MVVVIVAVVAVVVAVYVAGTVPPLVRSRTPRRTPPVYVVSHLPSLAHFCSVAGAAVMSVAVALASVDATAAGNGGVVAAAAGSAMFPCTARDHTTVTAEQSLAGSAPCGCSGGLSVSVPVSSNLAPRREHTVKELRP